MTIELEITCDRCGFLSDDRFDFYDRHFSRISDDGNDLTEYFHLCKACQHIIGSSRRLQHIDLILKNIAKSQYEGVRLVAQGDEKPDLSDICRVYEGIII